MRLASRIKGTVCAALAAALLLTGCSTPKVAATVDGKEYSTGVYLAYLYMMYQQTFANTNLSIYAQFGMDPWEQTLSYGEGDNAENLSVNDYIIRLTQDTIVRQKALENKLEEYGLTYDEEELKAVEEQLEEVKNDQILPLGFNKESYGEMLKAYSLNERTLFYGLYDKGGDRAMSEEDIRAYFDKNFLSYKIIEISLMDTANSSDLSDEEADKIREQLQGYLELYNENGDFDKVIEKYNEDKAAASTTTTAATTTTTAAGATTATTGATTTAAPTTTTTAPTTTTTAAATTTTTAAADGDDAGTDSGDSTDEETDENLKNIDANTYGDKDFTDAVKSIPVGEAKVVEYKKGGSQKTAALILRLDPEEANDNYFEESRENILYGAKYEEFNKEIQEYASTLEVNFNKSVVNRCTPKKMEEDASK